MRTTGSPLDMQTILDKVVANAMGEDAGSLASYIPELACVSPALTGISIMMTDGHHCTAGNVPVDHLITLQSAAKPVLLAGLLEEFGAEEVFKWTRAEPSGSDFASIARLDQFGPLPSNPMLNAGAISLCSHIPGETIEERLTWLETWMEKCFAKPLRINQKVFNSERRTGERNRALAYLMKSTNVITANVEEVLEIYFYLCSFEINLAQAANFPKLLANAGLDERGEVILTKSTVSQVLSLMATCGLYNESGRHLVRTGLPAKSSVSGFILAVAPGKAGIAAFSPLVNSKGTSMRGELMLEQVANEMDWHFGT